MSDIAELAQRLRYEAIGSNCQRELEEAADALEAQAEDLAGYRANELQLERWVEERDKRLAELEERLGNCARENRILLEQSAEQRRRIAELENHPFQMDMYEKCFNSGFAKAIEMAAEVARTYHNEAHANQSVSHNTAQNIADQIKALKQ